MLNNLQRPEGSRKLSLLSVQTFGTVRKGGSC
jgi:hypothetical protein